MNKEKVVCAAIRYTLKKPNAKKIFERVCVFITMTAL